MTIIATCGHEIPDNDEKYMIAHREYDRMGDRTVSYSVVCLKCQEQYREWGYLLETKEQKEAWVFDGDYHGEGTA